MTVTCYSRTDLEAYLRGRADDELSDAIELHVQACVRCEETLSGLDGADDTLVRLLQITPSEPSQVTLPSWIKSLSEKPLGHDGSALETPAQTPTPSDDAEHPYPVQLGDYQLTRILGRGGMSIVFGGAHQRLGRNVAIKLMLPHLQHAVSRERFIREMRTIGKLHHRNIAQATDAGEYNGKLYLVMEPIHGIDLNYLIKHASPLHIADACQIAREVASGLAHAHEKGVIHRDVKPSNIMLRHDGAIKILDFGLARRLANTDNVSLQTTIGQLIGTLDYMAPEQAAGTDVDERADVYGLGATLFKMLTGTAPHGRSADQPVLEFLHRLAIEQTKPVTAIRPCIPDSLSEVIDGMLTTNPANRIRCMDEVIDALQPFCDEQDITSLAKNHASSLNHEHTDDDPSHVRHQLLAWIDEKPDLNPSASKNPKAAEDAKADPPTDEQRRPPALVRNASWLIALALALTAALAVAMTLKTPYGEIVIESEIDDVKLEFVGEDESVDRVLVERGLKTTKIATGPYRVQLGVPLDNIDVQPDRIVITKNNVFKVVVSQRETSNEAPTNNDVPSESPAKQEARSPQMQLQLGVELAEATRQLAAEREQENPNQQRVEQLEKQIEFLRASRHPIPTEPVYQGRTLADWRAQLKFEKDPEVVRRAAASVNKLAESLPNEQAIDAILEAGAATYSTSRLLSSIDSLVIASESTATTTRRLQDLPKRLAAEKVCRLLNGPTVSQAYGFRIACQLQPLTDSVEFDTVRETLKHLANREESERNAKFNAIHEVDVSVAKIVYALYCENEHAKIVLESLDLNDAGAPPEPFLAAFRLAEQRGMSTDKKPDWLARYLINVQKPMRVWRQNQKVRSDTRGHYWVHLEAIPELKLNVVDIIEPLDADVVELLGRITNVLLDRIESRIDTVGDGVPDSEHQLEMSDEFNAVCGILQTTALSDEVMARASKLIQRRLEQVLALRDRHALHLLTRLNSPRQLAPT